MADNSKTYSISLYDSQVEQIRLFKNHNKKRFKSDASVFQYIVDYFFTEEQRSMKTTFLTYLGYPILIEIIILYISISINNINQNFHAEGKYIIALEELSQIVNLLGFAVIGVLIASMYMLHTKTTKKKV